MCGIVGYVGKGNVQEVLLHGLEKLEYRGYDSAGILVVDADNKGHLFKEKGRIADLLAIVDMDIDAHVGIGHTRWATHGVPSVENAHPHQSTDGRFTLVHNGVIENFKEIKDEYLQDVTFVSQTDTEIVVQLIGKIAAEENLNGKEALRRALSIVRGSYAFALVDTQAPNVFYAAKNKSPLLIGLGDDFNVVASDAMATVQITNQYVEIHDGEMVTLTAEGVTIETLNGKTIARNPYTAQIDASDLEKGTYPYYMLKEIDEQPAVMRNIVQKYQNEEGRLTVPEDLVTAMLAADRIHIVACGTSYHSGWVGKHYLEKFAQIPTEVHVASEFSYNPPLLTGNPFFVFLTQSGETADSRQVLVKVKEWGYPSLTITNVAGSTLSREADFTLLLHAGPEIAVASTKAYTAQIAVLAVLSDALGAKLGHDMGINMVRELGIVATAMEAVIDDKERIGELANIYLPNTRNAFYIGRGLDYYVSMEAALKLKEISYIQTEGFAAGELKHGTIALIEEGTPVLAIITQANVASHTRGNIEEVRSRGANTCVFAMEGLAHDNDQVILPAVHPALAPLLTVVPTQLMAYYATLARGYDVDKPRNLAKSVTVE
ncbi:glutamine amidotransferases class-ii [Trichococcus palustris]|uniref:Glutamine--fructose-6-phosphate aminotransferase [isomerizing] n=1 Tax=Trichococcus palustris TaxID=140314 RepID=A0A143YY22_9LACT|nr:glutamine--fructose-6-phosphate transaminase (isomerizing) [Trichococcus palustris]CZR01217.1 glutamine amidotransferases class-ii [Trichococcus palustris]SFL07508.1 glucosamine--fructose-6-phosphate aminotransferase (isomerizing) [Trichococcus palustris]